MPSDLVTLKVLPLDGALPPLWLEDWGVVAVVLVVLAEWDRTVCGLICCGIRAWGWPPLSSARGELGGKASGAWESRGPVTSEEAGGIGCEATIGEVLAALVEPDAAPNRKLTRSGEVGVSTGVTMLAGTAAGVSVVVCEAVEMVDSRKSGMACAAELAMVGKFGAGSAGRLSVAKSRRAVGGSGSVGSATVGWIADTGMSRFSFGALRLERVLGGAIRRPIARIGATWASSSGLVRRCIESSARSAAACRVVDDNTIAASMRRAARRLDVG